MKTMLRFITAVAVFVAGVQSTFAQPVVVPDHLPIGTSFPPSGTSIRVVVMYEDPTNGGRGIGTNFLYSKEVGTLEDVVHQETAKLLERFVPKVGTETATHMISVYIDYPVAEMGGRRPIGWSHLESNRYSLTQINGEWKFPASAASSVKLGFQSYMGVYAKGLHRVELSMPSNLAGTEFTHEVSPNGITDVTCSQYPSGVAYDGPDMLQVSMGIAYPSMYRNNPDHVDPTGYETLWFGTDESFWAVYDLTTGRMTDSHLPPPEPLRLVIEPVAKVVSGAVLGSTGQVQRAVKLSVTGPIGATAVLECTDVVGGRWTSLRDLVLVSGTNEFVDDASPTTPSRFYRVRSGN